MGVRLSSKIYMKKLTQRDIAVLYLANLGRETRVCEMRGRQTERGWLGSETDKRMYEVMEEVALRGFYEVEGIRYVIEDGKQGKYKTYRVVSAEPKPKPVFWVRHPLTGERITTEQYAML